MADFENNVHHLASVPINGRDQHIAVEVAADLVHSVVRKPWFDLTDRQKQLLVKPSTKRLWDGYMAGRRKGESTKEAARKAMLQELSVLEQQFKSGSKRK